MRSTDRIRATRPPELIRHLLLSWLIAVAVEWICLPSALDYISLDGIAAMSMPRLLCVTAGSAVLFWIVSRFFFIEKVQRWMIVAVAVFLSTVTLIRSFAWALFVLCLLLVAILTVYAIKGFDDTPEAAGKNQKSHWAYSVTVGVLATGFFIFVSIWTVNRLKTFCAPNFDFGIFAQMFHHMKQSGLPMTTVERDTLLSHFNVHVSPIYYLILPVYWLFPYNATLQLMQALILASAVIPLWLLCKQHNLPGLQRMLLCAILLLLPAVSGGTSYDIHENCFLLPLILWLLYAIDSRRIWLTALSALLTLMVKEDAAVYVAIAALYLILRTLLRYRRELLKDLVTGIAVLLGAIAWFMLVTNYLAEHGDGVMSYRYDNYIYDGSESLLTVIKSIILCPMRMFSECLQEEKLIYIMQTLLPLLGLPLLTRRYERYLLLIPYFLVNLMPSWQYQYDIFFQYNFGSTAFLIYLTLVNLKDLKQETPRLIALSLSAAVSLGFFCGYIIPKGTSYPALYSEHQVYYDSIAEKLDQIPDDASVTAHTFYGAYLSKRDVLYDLRYCSKEHMLQSDYVVIKSSYTADFKKYGNSYESLVALLEENGFVLTDEYASLRIFKRQ